MAVMAQDPDYTDFRSTRESFARLYDKVLRSDLTAFTVGGIGESVNKPVLKKVPAVKYGDDFISFDSNDLHITIRAAAFVAAKHKLYYEGKFLTKIDNKPYFGNYTKLPQFGIASLTVVVGKDTVLIPPNAISDLYNPHFVYSDASGVLRSQDAVYLSADKRRIYIYMLNKDEKGSYEITWVIQDNKYLRRVIDFGFTPGR
jgi:hypothetical protein